MITQRGFIKSFFYLFMFFTIPVFSQKIVDKNETLLKEKYRPQFHFSPLTKWTNDPNGLVYYDGEYHLFYQHFPDSSVWGPMHWGHAVSKDLIHWEHLPIALYPDSLGYIFSGSAVVDWRNSSGFSSSTTPPLVAIFTYHDPVKDKKGEQCQSQAVAYSTDKGRTWTTYKNNPVLTSPGIWNFRDPKVRFFEKSNKWIMTLACGDHVRFYSSPDLLSWRLESEFGKDAGFHGGVWECPDLVPLKVQGTNETKWILIVSINPGGLNGGSATQYFTGDFDGKTFSADSKEGKWVDYGTDNYAGVTWSDLPKEKDRQIFLGWMSNWQYADKVPTTIWRNAMTLPRELKVKKIANDYILLSTPVQEAASLRQESRNILAPLSSSQKVETGDLFELDIIMDIPAGKKCSLVLTNANKESVILSVDDEMVFDRTHAGVVEFEKGFAAKHYAARPSGTRIRLNLFVDTSSIEVFANDGEVVMTELVFPTSPFSEISVNADQGVEIKEATLYRLKTIWP